MHSDLTCRLMRLPQVIEATGLARERIRTLSRDGQFPRPKQLTKRAIAWRSDEVQAWIDARPAARLGSP